MFVAGTGGFLVVAPFAFGGCALEGSAAIAGAEELEVFDDDGDLAALGAGLVFPGVVLEAAFDEERFAFRAVLVNHFGLLAEDGAAYETGFFLIFAGGTAVFAVGGEAEIDD